MVKVSKDKFRYHGYMVKVSKDTFRCHGYMVKLSISCPQGNVKEINGPITPGQYGQPF